MIDLSKSLLTLVTTGLLFVLIVIPRQSLEAQSGSDEVFLFFLDMIHTVELQTGLAFANQSGTIAHLTLYFIDDSGNLLQGSGIRNQVSIDVGPGEQRARVLPEIFGAGIAGYPGFVIAESDNVSVVGFSLTFDPAIGMIDGTDALVTPLVRDGNFFNFLGGLAGAIIFQEVLTGPGSTNKIVVLALTGNSPGNGTLELIRDGRIIETQPINFPAAGFLFSRFSGHLEQIFGTPLQGNDFVRASSSQGIVGYQSVGRSRFLAGLNAVPEPQLSNPRDNASFGAQLALTPGINTFLKAVNPTLTPMNLRVEAFPTGPGAAAASSPAGGAAAVRQVAAAGSNRDSGGSVRFLGALRFRGLAAHRQ